MSLTDDRLAYLVDHGGEGAAEHEVCLIAAELLARRAGRSHLVLLEAFAKIPPEVLEKLRHYLEDRARIRDA